MAGSFVEGVFWVGCRLELHTLPQLRTHKCSTPLGSSWLRSNVSYTFLLLMLTFFTSQKGPKAF